MSTKDLKILVELQFDESKFQEVLGLYFSLPAALRPNRWAWGEVGKTTPITNTKDFLHQMAGEKLGPYMRGERGVEHMISHGGVTDNGERYYLECISWLTIYPSEIRSFLVHMAQAGPYFGFACTWEEYGRRNRIIVRTDEAMRTESWAGRDTRKYLPGLYWLTLISGGMAKQHGISLELIAKAAEERTKLSTGAYLFRFYERPEDWVATDKVEDVLRGLAGAVDIRKIRAMTENIRSDDELMAALKPWA